LGRWKEGLLTCLRYPDFRQLCGARTFDLGFRCGIGFPELVMVLRGMELDGERGSGEEMGRVGADSCIPIVVRMGFLESVPQGGSCRW